MKKGIIIITVILLVLGGIRYYRSKQKEGLGKLRLPKPPKMRIVYSRKVKDSEREKITTATDVVRVLRRVWSSQIQLREEFIVLHLDQANRVIAYQLVGKGGISSTTVDVRLIFAAALEVMATSIIIAHNHPSGNLRPSQADIKLTERIEKIAEFHHIRLLDSIILTQDKHLSFSDEGLL